jgi:hypothetical protein
MTDSESETIFDPMRHDYGHLNLRCHFQPWALEPVEEYARFFNELRSDPEQVVMSFIVGVPQTGECEGFGSEIPDCLDHPDMDARITPLTAELVPACTSSAGSATPGRRYVELARMLGDRATVHSICSDDYSPALEGITNRLHDVLDCLMLHRELPVETDDNDPCLCRATCSLVEQMEDDRLCPASKPCVRSEDPLEGCVVDRGRDELFHSLCTIAQLGTRMVDCDPLDPPACDEPGVVHAPEEGEGWYYMGRGWMTEDGVNEEPEFKFTRDVIPGEDSQLYIQCEECLGEPELGPSYGGEMGAPCRPHTCPPLLDEEGIAVEGVCGWEASEVYLAEAEECPGGACLVFRADELHDPFCSRRCGPGAGIRGCPSGYECAGILTEIDWSHTCYCVDKDQLDLRPGGWDEEAVNACR